MDSETAMRRVVREISHALMKYARQHNWKDEDYWIYYSVDSEWDLVKFVFVAREFPDADELKNYLDVWRYLQDAFKDEPEILKYAVVVVRSKAQVDRGGLGSIGSKYRDFFAFYPVSQPT